MAFDQVTNKWSDETINAAMSDFQQTNFVQSGSVSFMIGNVQWNGNGKDTIVKYQASKMCFLCIFSIMLFLHSRRGMDGPSTPDWPYHMTT